MSEVQDKGTKAPGGGKKLVWAGLGLIAVAAILYGAAAIVFKSGHGEGLKALATGSMAKLEVDDKPQPAPQITAQGPGGETVSLKDFKGDVVVVNLWATWCAPCVKEMPTLAKLQGDYAGKPVKVMAISLDKGEVDLAKAKAFIADKPPLQFYHGSYDLAFSINPPAEGLPTTLIYDRQGRERARLSGGADWSTPQAKAVLQRLLAQNS